MTVAAGRSETVCVRPTGIPVARRGGSLAPAWPARIGRAGHRAANRTTPNAGGRDTGARANAYMLAGLAALAILPLTLAVSVACDSVFAVPAVLGLLALPAGWLAKGGRMAGHYMLATLLGGALAAHTIVAPFLYESLAAILVNSGIGAALAVAPFFIMLAAGIAAGATAVSEMSPEPDGDRSCLDKLTPDRAVVILDTQLNCHQFNTGAGHRLELGSGDRGRDFLRRIALFDRPLILDAILRVERGSRPVGVTFHLADPDHPLKGGAPISASVDRFGAGRFLITIDCEETEPAIGRRACRPAAADAPSSPAPATGGESGAVRTEPSPAGAPALQENDPPHVSAMAACPLEALGPGNGEHDRENGIGDSREPPPPVLDEDEIDWSPPDRSVAFTRSYSQFDPPGEPAPLTVGWR